MTTATTFALRDRVIWSNHMGTEFAATVTEISGGCLLIRLDRAAHAYANQIVTADELSPIDTHAPRRAQ